MAIFVGMRQAVTAFFNRPIAEDFGFKNQIWQSLQSGVYVFLFIYLFGGSTLTRATSLGIPSVALLAIFGAGCVLSTLTANWVVPSLLPTIYNEDRWTVWKYILQTLFVLFCVSVGNQVLMLVLRLSHPTFGQMYVTVTIIGFFPIIMSVFITEQRRLKRNLAHAHALNEQLAHKIQPARPDESATHSAEIKHQPVAVSSLVVLPSDTGKERLMLQPDQLLYIESVGNYVEVHWLNKELPQKTVLRNTLKEIDEVLAEYPQFFRSHRAYLINLKAVNQTEGNARGYQLTLNGVITKIPVSRGYLDAFDERMRALVYASHSSQNIPSAPKKPFYPK